MREFYANLENHPYHVTDRAAIFAVGGAEELAEKLSWISIQSQEKDVAKHFPGPHFKKAGMNLLPAFKEALASKAAEISAKRYGTSNSLRWIAAKAVVENGQEDQAEEHLQEIIQAAKTFVR
ncbi:MAG: hypothetical protein KBD23_00190 [Gammaproteobacteria bacterium]|nr:hypothetical protein [Gammaproteobacteria bacterium]MBP9728550.1 hypothetical protein [Gammaproteobacteria bacterium]